MEAHFFFSIKVIPIFELILIYFAFTCDFLVSPVRKIVDSRNKVNNISKSCYSIVVNLFPESILCLIVFSFKFVDKLWECEIGRS